MTPTERLRAALAVWDQGPAATDYDEGVELADAARAVLDLVEPPPSDPASWPTSDPATWVKVPPNTAMAAAALLHAAADRYRVNGWPVDADALDELAARLDRALARWTREGL